jgi:hypothetical protein
MTTGQKPVWESMRTDESRMVEDALMKAGFDQVDAYRYNSASLRVRVIDHRFEGIRRELRDALVEPYFDQLPESTQTDIVNLVLLSPEEYDHPDDSFREILLNSEFDNPSPSML